MKFTNKFAVASILCAFISLNTVAAEEVDAIFTKVKEYMGQQNYTKALEELSWAKQEIEKKNSEKLQTFFPETIGNFKGEKTQINSALGFTSIEKKYQSPDKGVINLSLTGGSAAGAAGGLGGLAQIGKMAAMFGNQAGMETVRIGGRTATIEKEAGSKSSSISIFLDSGSVLKAEAPNSQNTDELKNLLNGIKIDDLDKYMKGN